MKFNVGMTLFVAALFVLLTPGVVVSLPKNGPLLHKAVVHGILFAIIYHFTHKAVWTWLNSEGFAGSDCPQGKRLKCPSNKPHDYKGKCYAKMHEWTNGVARSCM